MSDEKIYYRSGYKYQLDRDYFMQTAIKPLQNIVTDYIALTAAGGLTIKKGYAWDGTSGPVIDSDQNQRASLVHDALYQLMRMERLSPRENYKDSVDRLFRDTCIADGVLAAVAELYYQGLKLCGEPSTEPENARALRCAP